MESGRSVLIRLIPENKNDLQNRSCKLLRAIDEQIVIADKVVRCKDTKGMVSEVPDVLFVVSLTGKEDAQVAAALSQPSRVPLARILESGNLSQTKKELLFQNLLTCIQKLHSLETAHGEIDLKNIWVEDSIYVALCPFSPKPTTEVAMSTFSAPELQGTGEIEQVRTLPKPPTAFEGSRSGNRSANAATSAGDLWAAGVVGLCLFGGPTLTHNLCGGLEPRQLSTAIAAALGIVERSTGRRAKSPDRLDACIVGKEPGSDSKGKANRAARPVCEDERHDGESLALIDSIFDVLENFPTLRSLLAIDSAQRKIQTSTRTRQRFKNRATTPASATQAVLDLKLSIQEIIRTNSDSRQDSRPSNPAESFTCSLIIPDINLPKSRDETAGGAEIRLTKAKHESQPIWTISGVSLDSIRDLAYTLDLKINNEICPKLSPTAKSVSSQLSLLGPVLASFAQGGAEIKEERWIVMEDPEELATNVIKIDYRVKATPEVSKLGSDLSLAVSPGESLLTQQLRSPREERQNSRSQMANIRADSLESQKGRARQDIKDSLQFPEQSRPPQRPIHTKASLKPTGGKSAPVESGESEPIAVQSQPTRADQIPEPNPGSQTAAHQASELPDSRISSRDRSDDLVRQQSLGTTLASTSVFLEIQLHSRRLKVFRWFD